MITRKHFALPYSGCDPALPPPLCFTTHPAASHRPTQGRMYRAGTVPVVPSKPSLMMDPSDPSTWQRQYVFTR